MTAAALLPILLLAAVIPETGRFDLVCTAGPRTARYRVDLPAARWCEGDCAELRSIAGSTAATLTLADDQKIHSDDLVRLDMVDRATGTWRADRAAPPLYQPVLLRGSCRPVPFSGFAGAVSR